MNRPLPHHISSQESESSDAQRIFLLPDRPDNLLTDCALSGCRPSATERRRHLVQAAAGAKRATTSCPGVPFTSASSTPTRSHACGPSQSRTTLLGQSVTHRKRRSASKKSGHLPLQAGSSKFHHSDRCEPSAHTKCEPSARTKCEPTVSINCEPTSPI
jgi:hypothetical protein